MVGTGVLSADSRFLVASLLGMTTTLWNDNHDLNDNHTLIQQTPEFPYIVLSFRNGV